MEGSSGRVKIDESCDRVGIKGMVFWPEKPALWFAQMEGQFILSGITSDATKFYHVISKLDVQTATEVEDIIVNPPAQNKYDKLKQELITRLSASREHSVRQLLSHEELGDRKPSQFLRHLQGLAGPHFPEDFLRSLWSSRLPTHTQAIIATQTAISLDDVAKLADKINEVTPHPQTMCQVAVAQAPVSNIDAMTDLNHRIDQLTAQVAALTTSRSRSRSTSRCYSERLRSRSRSGRQSTEGWCWYHWRFREQATKCRAPCSFRRGAPSTENSRDSR